MPETRAPANSFGRKIEVFKPMRARLVLLFVVLAAIPTAAAANVIWPAAILTTRQLAWWVIGVSLVIEWYFVWRAFRLTPVNALWATLAANGLSAGIGLFFVPFIGILFAAGLHYSGLDERIGWQDFSPADWAMTYVLAVAFAVAIELAVFRFGFKLPVDKRAVGLIALANIITVGLALASLQVIPHQHY